jgi:hypothetical protein
MQDLAIQYQSGAIKVFQFFYNAIFPITQLLANTAITIPIQIQADSDFVVRKSMVMAFSAPGVPIPNPDFLISMYDTGSGKNWQDVPFTVNNSMGTAQLPFLWPEPQRVSANSTINVTLTNNLAIAALAYVTLSGMKVYQTGSGSGSC